MADSDISATGEAAKGRQHPDMLHADRRHLDRREEDRREADRRIGGTAPRTGNRESLRTRTFIRSRWAYYLAVILFDSLVGALSVHAAIRLRYDFLNRTIPNNIEEVAAVVTFFICAAVWSVSRVPRAIWRYLSFNDVVRLGQNVFGVTLLLLPLVMFLFVNRGADFPRLAPFVAAPIFFAVTLLSRLIVVAIRNGDIRTAFLKRGRGLPNAMLVGSPAALSRSVKDISRKRGGRSLNVVGMIDIDAQAAGRSIAGVPVIGNLDNLPQVYRDFASRLAEPLRLIAVDTKPDRAKAARLVRTAAEIGAPLSRVASGGKLGELTPFEAQDLIGRRQRNLDITPVRRLVGGRRVLITGAGGSIGSELSRQVARLGPVRLTLVDQSEFNLYTVDRQIGAILRDEDNEGRQQETKNWDSLIADVTDRVRMEEIFNRVRPHIVLHAAALKHVPLGEANPLETLHTNVEGTRVMLDLCVSHGVEAFTLVSTDKAVNISNVMGASKSVAEMLTHSFDTVHDDLAACAVRFGNVLASAGSVIPLFDEQIAAGGPVTVTDPDATRFFMTVEEAAALVLQATALDAAQRSLSSGARDSSIYVLEMGDPVNIASLARQLIRLRGKVPDRDVNVVYTGLRPGEVLAERVVGDPECLETTYVDGVLRITGIDYDPATVPRAAARLVKAVRARDLAAVRRALLRLLPSYTPNGGLH